jgi:hypothetical protein
MIPLCCAPISTRFGQKSVEVYLGDICLFDETIDILTTSAFVRSYNPTPRTVFEALNNIERKVVLYYNSSATITRRGRTV